MYDLWVLALFIEMSEGEEPSARFGPSLTRLDDSCFALIGGSDGNDLLRNGRELRDVS